MNALSAALTATLVLMSLPASAGLVKFDFETIIGGTNNHAFTDSIGGVDPSVEAGATADFPVPLGLLGTGLIGLLLRRKRVP